MLRCGVGVAFVLLAGWVVLAGDTGSPYKITLSEVKSEQSSDASVPVDPKPRIRLDHVGQMAFGLTCDDRFLLTCGAGAARTFFKVDDKQVFPATPGGGGGAIIPRRPGEKLKNLHSSSFVHNSVRITQTIELVPSKPATPNAKRAMDAVIIRYTFENLDTKTHTVTTRVRIDTMCGNNDGALFAAPTMPDKILDGIELKEKTLPDVVQIMENPDLKNPGFHGYFNLKLGANLVGPDRFLCTRHGAAENDGWNVDVTQAMGDSDCVIYWPAIELRAKTKVVMAYGYGKGIAMLPEGEGRVTMSFRGSFEPNKIVTIHADVEDPLSNQTLTLDLPAGIELLEGKQTQPVPLPEADGPRSSVVTWRARVREMGTYDLALRSNNGVVQKRTVTISK